MRKNKVETTKGFYEGKFNWYGEIYTVYRWAENEKNAKSLMLRYLAKMLNINSGKVRLYFDGRKDNYKIKIKEKING
jgi:hypothetical protein